MSLNGKRIGIPTPMDIFEAAYDQRSAKPTRSCSTPSTRTWPQFKWSSIVSTTRPFISTHVKLPITRSLVHFRKSLTWLFPPFLSFPLINAPPFNFRDGEGEIATAYGNSRQGSQLARARRAADALPFLPSWLPSHPFFSVVL